MELDPLEPRLLLSAAAQFIDSPTTLPLPYDTGALVVGDQVIFSDAENPSGYNGAEIYNFDTGQWTTKQFDHNLGFSSAVVGDKAIYAGGGTEFTLEAGSPGQSNVDIYDAGTGQWSTSQLSSPRVGMQTAVVGSKVLFIGGVPGFGLALENQSVVDVFDATNGTWSIATLSVPRFGFASTVVDGTVLVAGGVVADYESNSPYQPSNIVDVYDAASGQWSTTQMPEAMGDPMAASVGDFALFADIYAAQGIGPSITTQSEVQIYDASTGAWSTHLLSQTRSELGAAVVGNEVIFAGGSYTDRHGHSNPTGAVDIFHADTGTWTTSQMPVGIQNVKSATLDDEVMFTGAANTATVAEFYNTSTGQWSVTNLLTTAYNTSPVAVAGKFVVSGTTEVDDGNAEPTQLALEIFSPTNLPPPVNQGPMDGSNLGPPPGVFRWTPTPGATSYDIYVDGTLAANVTNDRWAPTSAATSRGSHMWFIAANVDGGIIRSVPTGYYVHGFVAEARLQDVNLPATITSGSKGNADVTINIANLADPPTSIGVAVYASAYDDLSLGRTLLGGRVINFTPSDLGTIEQLQIPLSIPDIAVGEYSLVLALRIRGSTFVIYLKNKIITISTPPTPSPFSR